MSLSHISIQYALTLSYSTNAPSPRGVHCKSSLHENENCWTSDSGWGRFRGGFWLSSMRSFPGKLGFCWYLKVISEIMTNILQYAKDLAAVTGEWVSGDKFWAALPYCNEQLVAHVITRDILTSKKQNSCINTWGSPGALCTTKESILRYDIAITYIIINDSYSLAPFVRNIQKSKVYDLNVLMSQVTICWCLHNIVL